MTENGTLNKVICSILQSNFSKTDIEQIVQAMKVKKYITHAILPQSKENETFACFLKRFWDFDSSPYIREKHLAGQSLHRTWADTMLSRAKHYWIPSLGEKPIGSIFRQDIKHMQLRLATVPQLIATRKKDAKGNCVFVKKQLSATTINQIMRAGTVALKWAYNNGLIQNDCVSGIIHCHEQPKKRGVLTMSQAKDVFRLNWKDSMSKLANTLAMFTGMRMGEILGLQIQDITPNRIFVRHSWSQKEGLKCPKNGEERSIVIPRELFTLLDRHIRHNPYGLEDKNFVFWGYTPFRPAQARHFNEALTEALEALAIPNRKAITFHSWRHFFATNMADNIDKRKLQLVTGHKSLEILNLYAAHESEATLEELGSVQAKLFLPLLTPP